MDKERLKKLTFRFFDVYYGKLTSNDNNLDKYVLFMDDTNEKKFKLVPFNGKYLLGYYKKDFNKIKESIPPLTKWFYEKYITEWVENKYGYELSGVLLPLK